MFVPYGWGTLHTPIIVAVSRCTHRWVVCGALAQAYRRRGAAEYRDRCLDWLGEGIDIDPERIKEARASVQEVFGRTTVPIHLPIGSERDFKGIRNFYQFI